MRKILGRFPAYLYRVANPGEVSRAQLTWMEVSNSNILGLHPNIHPKGSNISAIQCRSNACFGVAILAATLLTPREVFLGF